MLNAIFGFGAFIFLSYWVGKNAYADGYAKGVFDGTVRHEQLRVRAKQRAVAKPPSRPSTVSSADPARFGLGWDRERIKL